jgi:hypothetical protein
MSDKDLASLCPSAKIYAAPEKRVVLSLNINGPKILVPCLSSGLGNGAHSMTVLNLGKLSIKTTRADLTIGLKWRSVGTCRPQTGMECKNTKLSQALLKKTQFIAFEFEEFGICEKLQYNSYVKVGDTYFLPAGISGDRYLVHLSKVNVHMCTTADVWEDAQKQTQVLDNVWEDERFKLFRSPVTIQLELDKPCQENDPLVMGVLVAAIDIQVTKAILLHANTLKATFQEIFPTSDAEKARKKRQKQGQLIQRHQIGLVRHVVQAKLKAKLAKLAVYQRKQAKLAELVDEQAKLAELADLAQHSVEEEEDEEDSSEEKVAEEGGATKKMEIKVIVEQLSIKFRATEDEKGDEWSKSVTPTQSLRMKVVDFEMQFSIWDTKESVLKARLHAISLEHLSKETSEGIDILKNLQQNASMRRLLQMATQLEASFHKHDAGKDGSLDIADVRALLLEIDIAVTDEQMAALTKHIDLDGSGKIEVAEFIQLAPMLCSRSSLDCVDFTMPLPSDLEQQPEKEFLSLSIEQRKDITRPSFKFGRIELTISSVPLRNAFDWMHLLQKAVQAPVSSETVARLPGDEDMQESSFREEKARGIAALRLSFESESEDIFLPPKLCSILTVDIEEVDVAIHDMLIGTQEAFIFRAGPLYLALSKKTPDDDREPYTSKTQVVWKRLRVLYGLSVDDMEWDLTEVFSMTNLEFSSEDGMPQDLSGATIEQNLEISEPGIRLEVSLKELLFLKALQTTFSNVNDGLALQSLAQAEQKQQAVPKSSPRCRREYHQFSRDQSMQIGLGSRSEGRVKIKFQRKIAKLSRDFKCPSIVLSVIDDLSDVQEQDAHAAVSKVKLIQYRMLHVVVSEKLHEIDSRFSAAIGCFDVQAQAVGYTNDMEALVEPFPLNLEISTSRFSTKQQIVFDIPSDLEITITPEHIKRPSETKCRFDRQVKNQRSVMQANIQAGLKNMGGKVDEGYREKMFMILSSLSPGEKRLIRNRTDLPIMCMVYSAHDCALKSPLMQFPLPAGGSVKVPTLVLVNGVLRMQPSRNVPPERTDPTSGLDWLNIGDTEPTTGDLMANAALEDALALKNQFTPEEWRAFGINDIRVGHFVKASTGSYFAPAHSMFNPAPGIQLGTLSKPEELSLNPSESGKFSRFTAKVEMEVQICMETSKVNSIMTDKGPQHSFKIKFEDAVLEVERVEQIMHRFFRRAGSNILLVGFTVDVDCDSEMSGILFDFGASLTHKRLATVLKRHNLIASDDQLCVLKEPTFERILDCKSPQMQVASLMVSSELQHVQVTAPWKLCNMLPKPARFQTFALDNPETLIRTDIVEPGGKSMRYSTLTAKAGVFVQLEMDGYTSPRYHLLRESRKVECPLNKSGDRIWCMLDMGIVGNSSEFVVIFYMKMVVINRTGLSLAFGCCRLAAHQEGKKKNTLEQILIQGRTDKNLHTSEKVMLRAASAFRHGNESDAMATMCGECWVLKPIDPEALPWNQNEPEITMLHLPGELKVEDAWHPCVKMAGDEAWTVIRASNSGNEDHILAGEQDETFSMRIPGPPVPGEGPKENKILYGVGVCLKRGIAPFQQTKYLTLFPKYTFVNDTGLNLQICQDDASSSAHPALPLATASIPTTRWLKSDSSWGASSACRFLFFLTALSGMFTKKSQR